MGIKNVTSRQTYRQNTQNKIIEDSLSAGTAGSLGKRSNGIFYLNNKALLP